jgi:hypothetical protein
MIRRVTTFPALFGIVALTGLAALPSLGSATPVVTLKARVVPIPGFPHTGNVLGAGAAVEFHYTIEGHEVTGGVPSQLRGVTFFLPKGTVLHPAGFRTCAPETLEHGGPNACPRGSIAGPVGSIGVVDQIEGELVRENAEAHVFFAPGNQLEFYVKATAPVSAQLIAATGHYVPAASPFSWEFINEVKLVDLVPGAPPISTTSMNLKVGSAMRIGRKVIYYFRAPKKCPNGGYPLKSELTFQSGEKATVEAKSPCPRKRT